MKDIRRIISLGKSNDISSEVRNARESFNAPTLFRVVVLDVIYDPLLLTDKKKDELRTILSTDLLLDSVARNSIIGRKVRKSNEVISSVKIFPPLFPPHLCMPVKTGEHVFVIYENNTDLDDEGFWISRVPEKRTVDDVNYTHPDRKFFFPDGQSLKDQEFGSDFDPTPGFPNGNGTPETFSLVHDFDNPKDIGKEYDLIVKNSQSRKVEQPEPVPRLTKRPQDLVFQGSNNTAIILGEDRTGPVGDELGKLEKDSTKNAGTIDMVVGRGQVEPTKPKIIKNTREEEETDKNPKLTSNTEENKREGDPDFITDKSRIYLSMKTHADKNFKIDISGLNNISKDESGACVIKTDQIRMIAREDIKLYCSGEPGNLDDAAAVVIKSDGNIVFIPGRNGFIKLGSDNASKAIVCTDIVAGTENGKVSAPPMKNTMGGLHANGGDGFGTYASKVLVDSD